MSGAGTGLAELAPGRYALIGELGLGQVGALRDAGRVRFAAAPSGTLQVDLGGVTRADSAGLALLVDWLAWARNAGRTLGYANVPAGLMALARISELEQLLA